MKCLRPGPSTDKFPSQTSLAEALIQTPFIIRKRNRHLWGVIPPTHFKWLERADSRSALSSLLLQGSGVAQPAPLRHGHPKAAAASLPPAERVSGRAATTLLHQHLRVLSFRGGTCTLSTDHFNPHTILMHRANQHHPQGPGPSKPTQPCAHLNPLPMPMVDSALHRSSSVAQLILHSQPTA